MKNLMLPIIVTFFVSACGGGNGGNSSLADVNENEPIGPVTDADTSRNVVSEVATVNSEVGIRVFAQDSDNDDTVSYSISENPFGLFSIDPATGILSTNSELDFESQSRFEVGVTATSSDSSQSTTTFTVEVSDYPEINIDFPVPFGVYTRQEATVAGTINPGGDDNISIAVDVGTEILNGNISDGEERFEFFGSAIRPTGDRLEVSISAENQDGESSTKSIVIPYQAPTELASIGSGDSLDRPIYIAHSRSNEAVYISDFSKRSVIKLDLSTGQRSTVVLFDGQGAGALAVDDINRRILVDRTGDIVSVDMDTQEVTLLSEDGPDLYFGPNGVVDMELDAANQRLIIANNRDPNLEDTQTGIVSVDLISGNRVLLSGEGVGNGISYDFDSGDFRIGHLGGMAYREATNDVFVVSNHLDAVIEVDLDTGNRHVFSDNNNDGVDFMFLNDVVYDAELNRLFVSDNISGLIQVSMLSGASRSQLVAAQFDIKTVTLPLKFSVDPDGHRVFAVGTSRLREDDIIFDEASAVSVIHLSSLDYQILSYFAP